MPRFARDRAARYVANRHGVAAKLFCAPKRSDGVRGFAALADHQKRLAGVDQRIAIAVFARDIHIHTELCHVLDELLSEHAGVIGCSAAYDVQAIQALCPRFIPWKTIGLQRKIFRHILIEGLAERIRFLADLLHHVVFVVAFFRGLHIPIDVHRRFFD